MTENISRPRTTGHGPDKPLAIILASGGMDSCVTTAIANVDYRLAMLHVGYGQRTEARELRAFNALADFYQAEHRLVCRLDHLEQIGGSSLTDARSRSNPPIWRGRISPRATFPFATRISFPSRFPGARFWGRARFSWGPWPKTAPVIPIAARNTMRRSIALSPLGTKPETQLEIVTPVIHLRKSEIVRRGRELGAPFELTWSCYQGQDVACGVCDSCALRLRAFEEAGVEDPLPYFQRPRYPRKQESQGR